MAAVEVCTDEHYVACSAARGSGPFPWLPTRVVVEAIEGTRGMTTADRKGEGPRDDRMTEERAAARDRAHWLVKEVQDCVPGAANEVIALLARARDSGWPEVLRAALYADAVA